MRVFLYIVRTISHTSLLMHVYVNECPCAYKFILMHALYIHVGSEVLTPVAIADVSEKHVVFIIYIYNLRTIILHYTPRPSTDADYT
jgi:hypothetical protein